MKFSFKERASWTFDRKVAESFRRIRDWYDLWDGNVYVAFSGGKDSTVLAHLAHRFNRDIPLVFMDTGLEYPELRSFALAQHNVVRLRPKKTFREVVQTRGWPLISKAQAAAISRYRRTKSAKVREYYLNGFPKGKKGSISKKWHYMLKAPFLISEDCCYWLKKAPAYAYEKRTGRRAMLGILAGESNTRMRAYQEKGCFQLGTHAIAWPIAFWSDEDIWRYIHVNNVPYASVYNIPGVTRTGCVFCGFGLQYDGTPNRFDLLEKTHPKLFSYVMDNLGMRDVIPWVLEGPQPQEDHACLCPPK